jgi:hypothetical protein
MSNTYVELEETAEDVGIHLALGSKKSVTF